MGTLRNVSGVLLRRSGTLANHEDCCCDTVSESCCGDDCSVAPKFLQVTISNVTADSTCQFCEDDLLIDEIEGTHVLEYIAPPYSPSTPSCSNICMYGSTDDTAVEGRKLVTVHDNATYGDCRCKTYDDMDMECDTSDVEASLHIAVYVCDDKNVYFEFAYVLDGLSTQRAIVLATTSTSANCDVCDEIESVGISETEKNFSLTSAFNLYDDKNNVYLCPDYESVKADIDVIVL